MLPAELSAAAWWHHGHHQALTLPCGAASAAVLLPVTNALGPSCGAKAQHNFMDVTSSGTSMDIYWHLLTPTGIYWHLLTPIDIYWHLLTSIDLCWHLLTSMGIYWPPLASIDLHWQLLTFIGHLLTSIGIYWHLLEDGIPPSTTNLHLLQHEEAKQCQQESQTPPSPCLLLGCPYLSDLSLGSAVRPLPTAVKLLTVFDCSSTLIPSLSGHCISQRLPFYSPFC